MRSKVRRNGQYSEATGFGLDMTVMVMVLEKDLVPNARQRKAKLSILAWIWVKSKQSLSLLSQ